MMYYIDAKKLADCMKEANVTRETLRFYTYKSQDRIDKFLAGGPTRDRFLLGDICNALNMLPDRFCKYQVEPGDESDNLAILNNLMDPDTPMDPDESHYQEWGKEPPVFVHAK
ncbi:MAG: hypothetical protein ACI4OH_05135 [Mitsuokella sp.]|uniref:hypothetical protein n=1 Tax=Mitsuokella sp. TaxID=2049034 RepID=UPI003F039786